MKPFKDLDEQIEILQDRYVVFNDIEKAKEYLLNNNYYNVINSYGKFFIDTGDEYIPNTNFDEITAVHHFDNEFKSVLFKYIIEAEKHLKSIIAYRFSEEYKTDVYPYPYLTPDNYSTANPYQVNKIIAEISKIIKKKLTVSANNSIKHYIIEHGEVPFWVTSNYMTLGQTIWFYKHLKTNVQNKIAKDILKFLKENLKIETIKLQPNQLISFLDNLVDVRNVVAHNNKILNYNCRDNTVYFHELHSKYGFQPNNQRQDIYNVFIVMQCFLSYQQYAQLNNTIKKRAINLNRKLSSIEVNKILTALGFPVDWHLLPNIPQ